MNQHQFQQEILTELRATRFAIENYIRCEKERREALARATFDRDQTFAASVSSRAQELRKKITLRGQRLAASRQSSGDPLSLTC
jgi:hypothetical protein